MRDLERKKRFLINFVSCDEWQADSMNTVDKSNGNFCNGSNSDIDSLLAGAEYKERDTCSPSFVDDPKFDVVDLRRQVVYLQVLSTFFLFLFLQIFIFYPFSLSHRIRPFHFHFFWYFEMIKFFTQNERKKRENKVELESLELANREVPIQKNHFEPNSINLSVVVLLNNFAWCFATNFNEWKDRDACLTQTKCMILMLEWPDEVWQMSSTKIEEQLSHLRSHSSEL